jgi:nicotinate-nucleotide adenylyltransferase
MAPRSRANRRGGGPRIGVFGGTFDPPHLGHLLIADAAREELKLDSLLLIPSGTPPHKRGRRISPAADRLAMTRLAARGAHGLRVSTLETARRGASYTVDTLATLAARNPGARLFLVIGEDGLDELHTWRDPDSILSLATLAVARRPRAAGADARVAGDRSLRLRLRRAVRWIDSPVFGISSSAIRDRARRGRSLRYLVPDAVAAYIARRGLYRAAPIRRGRAR